MRAFLISLAVGVLAGSIYGLLNVRSPAPPVIALIGLLGMLLGEQLVPLGKRFVQGRPVALHNQDQMCARDFGRPSRSVPQGG